MLQYGDNSWPAILLSTHHPPTLTTLSHRGREIHENVFGHIVCEMAAIQSRPQCAHSKYLYWTGPKRSVKQGGGSIITLIVLGVREISVFSTIPTAPKDRRILKKILKTGWYIPVTIRYLHLGRCIMTITHCRGGLCIVIFNWTF